MAVTNRHILVTRPQPQADQLASELTLAGFQATCQPLFHYRTNKQASLPNNLACKDNDAIYIFVSRAAAEHANQIKPLKLWSMRHVFAVGNATQNALHAYGIDDVIVPTKHDSEGLLSLKQLNSNDIANKNIFIVRGNGGRELLANSLTIRGANVQYIESYQREWLTLPAGISDTWRARGINTLLITSNALLESVVQLTESGDNFWQNTCLWLVVSERIAKNAKQAGIKNVLCSQGASNQAILDALKNLESPYDR
ncbi:uroporphyrinogen-III synthase [Thalassotalea euphylliae]|uniref:uroporphyrinogen-III synthase n=1 Tax=Thalassotalea euphylliae TaxID=1655234 RepID=UPI00363BD851